MIYFITVLTCWKVASYRKNERTKNRKSESGEIYMITGELKTKIDKIGDTLWTGGITSPSSALEQIT